MKTLAPIALGGILGLAACAQTPLEADYGHSYAEMTRNQVYDPATLSRPSTATVEGADAEVLDQAVKALRAEKIDRSKVAQPLVINVGSQGG